MGASACGEARKASSPSTEFVLMHLSQNAVHGEIKVLGVPGKLVFWAALPVGFIREK